MTALSAKLQTIEVTADFLKQGIPIIDVRTPGEWRRTGVIKGAHTIMFFDKEGRYRIDAFLKALNHAVDTQKPFALICHTGSRTTAISQFLDTELHYNVINLQGGMEKLRSEGYQPVPYGGE